MMQMTKSELIKDTKEWIKRFHHRLEQKKGWGDHPTDEEKEAFYIIIRLLGRVEGE